MGQLQKRVQGAGWKELRGPDLPKDILPGDNITAGVILVRLANIRVHHSYQVP